MDRIEGPLPSGPIFPIHPHPREQATPRRLKGRVVGVRPGRSGEVGTTQILTIRLVGPYAESQRLLNSEVEILLHPR